MVSFLKALEMRSVIALVAVTGSIALAFGNPQYAAAATSVLGTAVGGYFGQLKPHSEERSERK